ncbi:MAG: GntR family transcriptional regulator [Alistipes sp.]
MDFNPQQPIWLQIYNLLCGRIVDRTLQAEERFPSLRDLGMELQVNPNTLVRVYNRMQEEGIIVNRRGVGYFVTAEAHHLITETWRKEFIHNEVPAFFTRMMQVGVDFQTLNYLYNKLKESTDENKQ